jgi:molybdenum cofactor guanylyltransferase
MTKRAAIILSGGKAKRFQGEQQIWQDKALVELFEKPLLIHSIEKVRDLTEETVIIVNDENRRVQYSKVLARHNIENVKLYIDEKIDHLGGPLVAILTGLKYVEADYCLTLPSDMPLLEPKVIDYMFNKALKKRVVVPMWPNGRLETLLMVLERKSVLEIADTLSQLKRPRSDDIIRGALNVLFVSITGEIRTLDTELKSFVNINSREDLAHLQPHRVQGSGIKNIQMNLGALPLSALKNLRNAVELWKEENFLKASRLFALCAAQLEDKELFFWAALSRENEGKSLLGWMKVNDFELTVGQIDKVKKCLLKAASDYNLEAEVHKKNGLMFLTERARSDKLWCESHAAEKILVKERS